MGLLRTGTPVSLVTDAIAAVKPEDGARALDEFTAAGGTLTTMGEVTMNPHANDQVPAI
jgi:hypothetical protein